MLLQPLVAPSHEHPDERRGGVEDSHAVLLDDLPHPAPVGVVGGPLIEYLGDAHGQRAVDVVGVAGNPADVGGAPEHVLVMEIEVPLRRPVGLGHVAPRGMDDPLGLARGAAGVEDVEDVLAVHGLRLAVRAGFLHQIIPPVVSALGSTCLWWVGSLWCRIGACVRGHRYASASNTLLWGLP